jgi:hypothetical protein
MSLDWPNPVKEARAHGLREGQTMMRDKIAEELATFATTHPDPVVADELWAFVIHVRQRGLL